MKPATQVLDEFGLEPGSAVVGALSDAGYIVIPASDYDPPVCRLQFPDGHVPGNAKEAAEGWKREYDSLHRELHEAIRTSSEKEAAAEVRGFNNGVKDMERRLSALKIKLES